MRISMAGTIEEEPQPARARYNPESIAEDGGCRSSIKK
jgi:hypothetical protein